MGEEIRVQWRPDQLRGTGGPLEDPLMPRAHRLDHAVRVEGMQRSAGAVVPGDLHADEVVAGLVPAGGNDWRHDFHEPAYPEAARRANLQGTVVLDAIIAADGTVVNLHPISGDESLTLAAMDAARWLS